MTVAVRCKGNCCLYSAKAAPRRGSAGMTVEARAMPPGLGCEVVSRDNRSCCAWANASPMVQLLFRLHADASRGGSARSLAGVAQPFEHREQGVHARHHVQRIAAAPADHAAAIDDEQRSPG